MKVHRLVNSKLQSNSYILYLDGTSDAWIIDPGDAGQIVDFLSEQGLHLKGILITHAHFDHIYGINELQELLGPIFIYASVQAEKGFCSARINCSYYAEIPFTINCDYLNTVCSGNRIELWKDIDAVVHETPGHNDDCLSFEVIDALFTGDAMIPGSKVYVKSKKASLQQAADSFFWIQHHFTSQTIIYPGHKESVYLGEI